MTNSDIKLFNRYQSNFLHFINNLDSDACNAENVPLCTIPTTLTSTAQFSALAGISVFCDGRLPQLAHNSDIQQKQM